MGRLEAQERDGLRPGRPDGPEVRARQQAPPPAAAVEALAAGIELKRWWLAAAAASRFAQRFDLGRTYNQGDSSFGFFDCAEIGNRPLAIMGNFQRMFYDQAKAPPAGGEAGEWMRRQIREFVLRYFMRVSAFRQPSGYVEEPRPATPACLGPFSWCPREGAADEGFGFQQLYYRRRGSGEIGAFPEGDRFAIVDLRDLCKTYEWIVAKVSLFDFDLSVSPFGTQGPRLVLPLAEESYLVLSADFIVDEERPETGVLGRYGFGYAFVKNPKTGLLAYGPGEFEAAVELIEFAVGTRGQVEVSMAFVANRPERILSLPLNPVAWGTRAAEAMSLGVSGLLPAPLRGALARLSGPSGSVDPVFAFIAAANALSGGLAAQELCISREQLDKSFLVKHFIQHYQAIAGSLAVWRLVGDWLDAAALPRWVILGRNP
jgi:hypothetical protein